MNQRPYDNTKSVPDYMRRKGYWKVTDCLRIPSWSKEDE